MNGFAASAFETVDLTSTPATWTTYTLSTTIGAGQVVPSMSRRIAEAFHEAHPDAVCVGLEAWLRWIAASAAPGS